MKNYLYLHSVWCDGRVARHSSAKAATAVRFRFAPQKSRLASASLYFFEVRWNRTPCVTHPLNPPPVRGTSLGWGVESCIANLLLFWGASACALHKTQIPPQTPPLQRRGFLLWREEQSYIIWLLQQRTLRRAFTFLRCDEIALQYFSIKGRLRNLRSLVSLGIIPKLTMLLTLLSLLSPIAPIRPICPKKQMLKWLQLSLNSLPSFTPQLLYMPNP